MQTKNQKNAIGHSILKELTIDFAPEIIVWINSKGKIICANQAALNYFEIKETDFNSLTIEQYDKNISKTGFSAFWEELKKNNAKRYFAHLSANENKNLFIQVKANYLITEQVECVILIYHTQQENYITPECDNIKLLIENSPDTIIILNKKLEIIFCSNSIKKILDYTPNEIINKNFIDIVDEESKSYINNLFKLSLQGKEIPNAEISLIDRNKELCFTEINMLSIKTPPKEIILYLIIRDITNKRLTQKQIDEAIAEYDRVYNEAQKLNKELETEIIERKKIEQKLIEAKGEADFANKAKGIFLANMSHEIRTPLNAVLGFAEILRDKLGNDPVLNEYIEGINTGGRSLLSLINDILDLSKIDAGRLEIHKEAVNLTSIFNEVYQIFITKIKAKGLELKMDIDKKIPPALELDQARIRQILFNLIGNAVKFTQNGYISLTAKLEEINKNKDCINLMLNVKDTGIGIPRKQQRFIFNPFIQTEGQDNRKFGGTGLGLTITKRLVEIMNGTITVKSSISRGSVFTVYLKDVAISSTDKIIPKKSLNTNVQFKKAKILLVDDSISSRIIFKGFLKSYNFDIYEAGNGKIALDILKKTQPELIFMDIQMPVMGGFDAAREIKRNITTRFIPIIALSATLIKSQAENEVSNFDDFLLKPITKEKLIETLTKYIPYKSIKTKKSESKFPINEKKYDYLQAFRDYLKTNKKKIPALKKEFSNKIDLIYNEISGFIDIDDTKSLAKEFGQIGKNFEIDSFIDFGDELYSQASSFHLENIKKLLSNISEFKKTLN